MHRRSCLRVHELRVWPAEQGRLGTPSAALGGCPQPALSTANTAPAHASVMPDEEAGALLPCSRWRVSGCFLQLEVMVHGLRKGD